MSRVVMINGELVGLEDAKVSVFDRGFLYGDSVFETIRTYRGRPFLLDEHLRRLARSAELVLIEMPSSREALAEEVRRAVEAAQNAESYIRVMVTRGTGELGLDPGLARDPLRVVLVTPLHPPPPEVYRTGIHAVTYPTRRVADATRAGGAKVGNYLVAALAMREARAAGASEALVVDGRGTVVEGATSNVFAVVGGRLVTAPEEAGILPGITRGLILEVAQAGGIDVELRAPRLAELMAADEVLISSSIREIVPVVRIDGGRIGSGRPGALTQRLRADFGEKVNEIMDLNAGPEAGVPAGIE